MKDFCDEFHQDFGGLILGIRPLLADQPPELVGVVLADLTAAWLAIHKLDDTEKTAKWREILLEKHLQAIRAMIPGKEKDLASRATRAPSRH